MAISFPIDCHPERRRAPKVLSPTTPPEPKSKDPVCQTATLGKRGKLGQDKAMLSLLGYGGSFDGPDNLLSGWPQATGSTHHSKIIRSRLLPVRWSAPGQQVVRAIETCSSSPKIRKADPSLRMKLPLVPSFPSCTWERTCPRNFVASAILTVASLAEERQGTKYNFADKGRSQVQLGNEGKADPHRYMGSRR